MRPKGELEPLSPPIGYRLYYKCTHHAFFHINKQDILELI